MIFFSYTVQFNTAINKIVVHKTANYMIPQNFLASSFKVTIVTGFAKRSLKSTIINIYVYIFEALYLENAWCLFYAILHKSVQDNSMDVRI